MLSIIVAIAKNYAIGKDNKLLWHLPKDLKRFKQLTTGHTIIMGRKTFNSLGRVLPNRKHIILCNDMEMNVDNENVVIMKDISDLDYYINNEEENFVIGGATIYKLLMPYCNKMYVTEIDKEFDGDVYFPEIDKTIWKKTSETQKLKDKKNDLKYKYIIYKKRSKLL